MLIPGNVDDSISSAVTALEDTVRPIPLSQRKFLANFLGRAQGKAGRLQLLLLSQKFPEKVHTPDKDLSD